MSKSKKVTKEEVKKIAKLSKLSLSDSELKNHTYSENGNQLAFTDTVETTAGLYKSMYTLNKITGRFEKFQEKFTHSTSYANDKEAKWTLEKTSIDYYNCTKKEALF